MKQNEISLSKVNVAEYNPRTISEREMESLKESLKKYGCLRPLIINKRTNTLISGHQMLKASQQIGLKKLPYKIVNLSKQDEKKLNLALNKIQGEWDYSKLNDVLSSLGNLDCTGFYDFETQFFKDINSYQELDSLDFEFEFEEKPQIKVELMEFGFRIEPKDYDELHEYFGGKNNHDVVKLKELIKLEGVEK